MKKENTTEIKSYFKAPIKAEGGKPSIVEVDYVGADGITYKGLQFEGYASTSDIDRTNDVVLPEAFNDSIKTYMENPVILLQHDHEYPIGSVVEATIDSKGLFIKGIIKVDVENIYQSLRTGVIKTMSFGYRVNEYETQTRVDGNGKQEGYNVIKKLELFEISLVSVPMNPKAQIKSTEELKGLSDDEYIKYFQVNKKDEYSLFKSLNDLMAKYKENISEEVENIPENEIKNENENENETEIEIENEVLDEEIKEESEVGTNETPEEEITVEIKEEVNEDKPITEEKEQEEPKEEEKEEEKAIETPENIETVVGDNDTPEKIEVETPENEVENEKVSEVIEKVENIEKSFNEFKEKSIDEFKSVVEINNSLEKNVMDIKNISETVESLKKSNELLEKSNNELKSENIKSQEVISELTELTLKCYKALQRITADGSLLYKEEPKEKPNPILNTDLAKKLQSLRG